MTSLLLYGLLCLVFAAICVRKYIQRRPFGKSFPSPPSQPILGHLHAFPQNHPWLAFTEWKKQYGAIIQLYILGKSIIILNDAEDAHTLLDKRGFNYSDRPDSTLFGKILGMEYFTAVARYGDDFRTLRRFTAQYLNSREHTSLYPLVGEQVKVLLKNLLESPTNFAHHVDRLSAATVVKATYGHDILTNDDSYIKLAAETVVAVSEFGAPGLNFIDLFPITRYVPSWFPDAGFFNLARARKVGLMIDELINKPYRTVKKRRLAGMDSSSFVDVALEENEKSSTIDAKQELLIKSAAAQMYGAGAGTSADTIMTFILMMIHYPEVAKKAQAEIDKVIGNEQLPGLKDRPDLPYVNCILKEVMRINPSVPLGVAHASLEEDVYKETIISARTLVFSNIWAMMRDERYFPSPDIFNPDRYVSREQTQQKGSVHQLNTFSPGDPSSLLFGFGRRICPGRFLADANAWLVFANILAVFDILPPLDPITGKQAIPSLEWTSGLTSRPKPFSARFIPRSEKHASLTKQD